MTGIDVSFMGQLAVLPISVSHNPSLVLPLISAPRWLEPDRLYVIGDFHGRSDLLDRMVVEITRDLGA
jgi:hypothetical protein